MNVLKYRVIRFLSKNFIVLPKQETRLESMRLLLLVLASMLIFLGATTRWLGWDEAAAKFQASDVQHYQKIALAAPGLPGSEIRFHHAQRFGVHYLAGSFANATGISLLATYRGISILMAIVCLAVAWRALLALSAGQRLPALVALALFALSPFNFRYYAAVPGMAQDLLFVLGCTVLLLGLAQGCQSYLFLGAMLAAIGRQTALLLIPGLVIWIMLGAAWRSCSVRKRALRAFAVSASIVIVYILTGWVAARFASPSENIAVMLELFFWLSHEFKLSQLVELVVRILAPFVLAIALCLGAWRGGSSRGVRPELLACFLFVAGIAAQPLLGGPVVTGRNASRLAALGLIFSASFVALTMSRSLSSSSREVQARIAAAALAAAVIGSFHHLYSVWGPQTLQTFALLQAALGLIVLAVAWFAAGTSSK